MRRYIIGRKQEEPKINNDLLSKFAAKLNKGEPEMKEEQKPVVTVKEKKKRKPRHIRAFRYRGESFVLFNENELTLVCTLDKDSKTPKPIVEVPRAKATEAVRQIVKIIQAEQALDNLK